ncbi:MAG: hypothetical protein HY467_03100 [Betaproteobacteria bacterium]|nr:hypothetical protein [Betaproteobacteria bacterium]
MEMRQEGAGNRPAAANGQEFLPLCVACAKAQRALSSKPLGAADDESRQTVLDSVAYALAMVAPIYATDPLTNVVFPISEAEILRGAFKGGATQFARDGVVRYTGLCLGIGDFEDALRVLNAAAKPHAVDPNPRPRPDEPKA